MAGIILAGGKSERMGRDKALLPLNGRTLLERAIDLLKSVTDDVVIVADLPDRYSAPGARTVGDEFPGLGPVGGLLTGLEASGEAYHYLIGCDTPFIKAQVLMLVFQKAKGHQAAVPVIDGRPEPLCGVYHHSICPVLRGLIQESPGISMQAALKSLAVNYVGEQELRRVDPELISFTNLNTPEEYARANSSR